MKSDNKNRVLKEFQRDPYQPVGKIAKRLGLSFSLVSQHLASLEREGLIERKKLVRHYPQGKQCNAEKVNKSNKRTSKSKREQMLIERVVAKAQARGETLSAWSDRPITSMRMSGCKVG